MTLLAEARQSLATLERFSGAHRQWMFEPKAHQPSVHLELAASTLNPDFATKMLSYDRDTFGIMIHAFKPFYGLQPDDHVKFYDDGEVFFQGRYIGNIHDFAP